MKKRKEGLGVDDGEVDELDRNAYQTASGTIVALKLRLAERQAVGRLVTGREESSEGANDSNRCRGAIERVIRRNEGVELGMHARASKNITREGN